MMKLRSISFFVVLYCCIATLSCFSPQRIPRRSLVNGGTHDSISMWLFGNGKADVNKEPNSVEVTINGKPVKAAVNQKVSQVAAAARIPIQYSCRKGDCATCSISMNGRIVKACQEKIPKGKTVIQTL